MPKVLLWNKGDKKFSEFTQQGLAQLKDDDIQLLYKFEAVEAAGVPDLFAHAFMFSRQLEKSNHHNQLPAFQQFTTLVKGIFLNTIELSAIPMKAIGFWGNVAKEFQATQPTMDHFTLLTWRGEIVGGIYPECLVFPGAQVAQETLDAIAQDNLTQEEKFGSGVVHHLFTQWVDEITAPFRQRGDTTFPLWAERLRNMIDGWGTPAIPSSHQLTTVDDVLLIETDCDNLPADNRIVPLRHIALHRIQTEAIDIFCHKVVRFKNGKLPDFPVRLEHLYRVQTDAQHTVPPRISQENDKSIATYQVYLQGEPQPIQHSVEILDGDEASILLWPSFTAPDWNVNYVLFHASTKLQDAQPYIRVMMRDETITDPISGEFFGRQQLSSPAMYIELCIRDPQSGHAEVVGVFKDTRQELEPLDGQGTNAIALALDFGTSNTSLAMIEPISQEQTTFAFNDLTCDLLDCRLDAKLIREGGVWFPTYGTGTQVLSSVPSELIFESPVAMTQLNQPKAFIEKIATQRDLEHPIMAYSIPHPAYDRKDVDKHIISNFKWEDPFNSYKSDTMKAYLKLVLQMVFARIRSEKQKNYISVVVTYPLAFDHDRYTRYRDLILHELRDELWQETGLSLDLTPMQALIAESDAALGWCTDLGYQLIVDMGGGTTDITLSKAGQSLMAVDSIIYGGNTYIKKLLTDDRYWPEKVVDKDRNRSEITLKEREIILNRAIRKEGFREGVLEKYTNVAQRKTAEEKLQVFFEQLFQYLELLLEAHGAKGSSDQPGEQVSFYPFGNGWRFLEVLDHGNIDQYIERWFRSRGFNVHVVGVQSLKGADRKGTVAIGALKFADPKVATAPRAFTQSEDEGPIKSVVGCDVVVAYDAVERNIRKHKSVPWKLKQDFMNMERSFQPGKRPILSTKQFIESLKLQRKQRTKEINIIQEFNGYCDRKALAPNSTESSWEIKRSLFAIFLEDIFPDYYLNA